MSWIIRPAKSGDEGAIAAQLVKIHDLHVQGRPDLFGGGTAKLDAAAVAAQFSDPCRLCLVAEAENGAVAGYLLALWKENQNPTQSSFSTLYVDDLFVDNAFRRQGIASALMKEAEAFAKEKGCLNLTLNVWQFNGNAIALYQRLGFFPQRTIMEKPLPKDEA